MQKWYKNTYFKYTYLFLGVMLIVFLPFFLKGRTLINNADVYNQVYPFFVYISKNIRNIIPDFFSGQGIRQFDYCIGYGQNILGSLNFYGLGDIVYLLFSLIPVKFSAFAFSCAILLKIYLSGISFILLAKKLQFTEIGTVGGALFYSTSMYVIFYCLVIPSNLYPMILLPLMIIGADDLVLTDKKISKLLIISLFLQTISGFYYLYMNAIFIVVFYAVTCITYKISIADAFKRGVRCLWQASLGVGLGLFMLLPALMTYFESNRTGRSNASVVALLIPELKDFLNRLMKLFVPCGYEPGLGLPVVLVIILVIFFRSKEAVTKRWKILTAFFGIAYFIPLTGCIFNGGSYSVDRYVYMLYLLLSVGIAYTLGQNVKHIKIISVCFLANIVILGIFQNGPTSLGGKGWQAFFKSYDEVDMINEYSYAQAIEQLSISNNKFERVDIKDESPINASMIFGNNSVNSYYSINAGSMAEFYKQYGISSGIRSDFLYEGLDGRPSLESIMSVKKYQNISGNIVDNEHVLPLGILYTKTVNEKDANAMSTIEKNAIVTKALIVDGVDTNYEPDNLNIGIQSKIPTTIEENTEYYVLLPDVHYFGDEDYVDIIYGGKYGRIHREDYIYDNVSNDIMFMLPSNWKDSVTDINSPEGIGLTFTDNSNLQYGKPIIYSVDISDREKELNELNSDSLSDLRILGNGIMGNISVDKEGVMLISVPYSKGWKCYVDDVETSILRADYAFCGIHLDKGKHTVRMEYDTPGMKVGLIISLLCVIIFTVIVIYTRNRGKQDD